MTSEAKLVLLAHGSRNLRWRQTFEALLERAGPDVMLAYLEMCSPTLLRLANEVYAAGCRKLVVLPLFLSGGGHVSRDVSRLIREVEMMLDGMEIELLPAIGEHPKVVEVFLSVIRDACPSEAHTASKTGAEIT
ncbi:MAG: cobalamin biosynthesis protein CbiX [Vampirovibrio sp.]|jgi:sirohydrochlorin cobaltochelatase|nr:cobalamin biosynthesis protein CbiX [Vampirovibrio sp.]